jgi:L-threonylcarbamoyladenylate synthase
VNQEQSKELIANIKTGQAGVMPTDAIYGIVASVGFPETIERIYELTGRPKDKPFIVLAADFYDLNKLKVEINEAQREALGKLWPGPVSVILACSSADMKHIHRGKQSIAVRVPDLAWLRDLLVETGPIIATSANLSGQPTPNSLPEIKQSLPGLDFYVEGEVGDSPSQLVKIDPNGSLNWVSR